MRGRDAWPRLLLGAAVAVVVLSVPAFTPGSKVNDLVTAMAVGIVALALDLLVGSTGQLSLAHAAYYGVGTFTALNLGSVGLPWPLAVAGAMAATALVATVVGLPSLRIRGLQVAVASLAFQIFAVLVPDRFPGLKDAAFPRPQLLASDGRLYYFGLGCVAVTVLIRYRVRATRAGRSFVAVRDVEERAAAFGIAAGPTKLLAYGLSGGIAGLGGALFALQQTSISDTVAFGLQPSLMLVAIVVVGGARSSAGILLGAFAVQALPGLVGNSFSLPVLGSATLGVPILFSVLLIVSIVREPDGVAGALRRADRSLAARLAGSSERPEPRPLPVEPAAVAAAAGRLRDVPRPMMLRLPVPALLVATDVGVRYGGVQALTGLSLEVRRGEIVGLIGANGAGKSTFFNAVSGLAPGTGSIRYRGRELLGAPPHRRSRQGVVRTFQDMGLVRADSVRENLLLTQGWLAGYPAGVGILGLGGAPADEAALRRRADLALELFGLRHLAGERLGDLPYGTMRTVEIAAAVAAGPELLLLDEASAGLTPQESARLADTFDGLRDELGLTLLVIEHHVPLIARVCDYCYCLESGSLIAEGSPADVTAQPAVVESFLGKGSLSVSTQELAAGGVVLEGLRR